MNHLLEAPGSEETLERITTLDVCQLPFFHWPFLGVCDPDFVVEVQLALERYLQQLQEAGTWRYLRVVPHPADDLLPDHVFDVLGARVRNLDTGASRAPRAWNTMH